MNFSKAELYLTTRLEKVTISITFFLKQNIEIVVEFSCVRNVRSGEPRARKNGVLLMPEMLVIK